MSRRLVVSGGSRARELVLVDTLIVGRDPVCDISELNDPLMSRRHAAFSADATRAIVKDLGSRNGILVNGAKVTEASLRSGDVVQIGHLQVRFVDEVAFIDMPGAASDDITVASRSANADDTATVITDPAKTGYDTGRDGTRKL